MTVASKEDVKRISPFLEKSQAWHDYVDWFWRRPEMRKDYSAIALGFQAGTSRAWEGNNGSNQ